MIASSKTIFVASLIATTVIPVMLHAQATSAVTTPAAVPSKIAFVNLQEAVVNCNEGKQEAAALQQRFSAKQANLKQEDEELKKLKDDFQVVSAKLSDEERAARTKVIQDKEKAFERSYSDYQSETQEAQQAAINEIVKKMLPVLEKYVTDSGYTAVFDVSSSQAPVLWVRKSSMITKELIDAYNAQAASAVPATPGQPQAPAESAPPAAAPATPPTAAPSPKP